MNRRELTAALLVSTTAPFGNALAQLGSAVPTVGVLIWGSPGQDPYVEPLLQGLHDLGYADGRNIALDIRYAGADPERGRTAMAGLEATSRWDGSFTQRCIDPQGRYL